MAIAEDSEFDDMADTSYVIAVACERLAEELAAVATALHEGKADGAIVAKFDESMDFLLDAVDMFEVMEEAKAVAAEADDDEGMEDEEDEDEEEMGND